VLGKFGVTLFCMIIWTSCTHSDPVSNSTPVQAATAAARALLGLDDADSPACSNGAAASSGKNAAAMATGTAAERKPSGDKAQAGKVENPSSNSDAAAADSKAVAAIAGLPSKLQPAADATPAADQPAAAADDSSSDDEDSGSGAEADAEAKGADGEEGDGSKGKAGKPKRWDARASSSSEEDEVKVGFAIVSSPPVLPSGTSTARFVVAVFSHVEAPCSAHYTQAVSSCQSLMFRSVGCSSCSVWWLMQEHLPAGAMHTQGEHRRRASDKLSVLVARELAAKKAGSARKRGKRVVTPAAGDDAETPVEPGDDLADSDAEGSAGEAGQASQKPRGWRLLESDDDENDNNMDEEEEAADGSGEPPASAPSRLQSATAPARAPRKAAPSRMVPLSAPAASAAGRVRSPRMATRPSLSLGTPPRRLTTAAATRPASRRRRSGRPRRPARRSGVRLIPAARRSLAAVARKSPAIPRRRQAGRRGRRTLRRPGRRTRGATTTCRSCAAAAASPPRRRRSRMPYVLRPPMAASCQRRFRREMTAGRRRWPATASRRLTTLPQLCPGRLHRPPL